MAGTSLGRFLHRNSLGVVLFALFAAILAGQAVVGFVANNPELFLRQSGSPESKALKEKQPEDKDPRVDRRRPDAPWPVRRGGLALAIYQHSLTIALLALFVMSFVFHALGGTAECNSEARQHGEPTVSVVEFVGTSEFWFQSLQNWQSEFLAAGALVVLAVVLRQRGSPESKPVDAPHRETGTP